MTRGQVEAGFQWIFVLLAGGALLSLFFFGTRSCAQQGEERVQGLAAQAIAERLQSGAWQPQGAANITVRPLDAACIAGVITISSGEASSPVERAPVFLPPNLDGKLTLVTRPFEARGQDAPPLPLGGALYVLDENTYYILVEDPDGVPFPFTHDNVRRIDASSVGDAAALAQRVPASANTVILITDGGAGYITNAAVGQLPIQADVLGVSLGNDVEFFSRRDGAMVSLGRGPAENDLLRAGAIVSADPALYRCAREHLKDRSLSLTRLYAQRASALSEEIPSCAAQLASAAALLESINDDPEYLAVLEREGRELARLQNALLLRSCPVIA